MGVPALTRMCAGDAEQDIGGDGEEGGELGHERHGEAEPAGLVVGGGSAGRRRAARPCLLGEARLVTQLREATAELRASKPKV